MKLTNSINALLWHAGIILLLLSSLAACRNPGQAPPGPQVARGIIHPTPENIPDDADLADVIRIAPNASKGETATHPLVLAPSNREVATIGVDEGGRYDMIGRVQDIAVDETGQIYLLDSRYNEVRVYSRDGAFVQAFGGPGQGPGEFQAPRALAIASEDLILVAEQFHSIKVFEKQKDTFVLRKTIGLDFAPNDLCIMNDLIYVHGLKEGNERATIHVFTLSGEHELSFGESYKSANPSVRYALSRGGLITCNARAQVIATMSQHVPILTGYTTEGVLKWQTRFADFNPLLIEEVVDDHGRPGVQQHVPKPGEHVAVQLTSSTEEEIIAQVVEIPDREKNKRPFFHTFAVSAHNGRGTYIGAAYPLIYTLSSDHFYTGSNLPFPQVKIYARTAPPTNLLAQ
jgi:hypothetical protein